MLERKRRVDQGKLGIYLNIKEMKVERINSPHWIPEEPDWIHLTPEVNMTLLNIRKLAGEKGLVSEPGKISWS
jgi:hypothetical protein